jgi:hypothetical protein
MNGIIDTLNDAVSLPKDNIQFFLRMELLINPYESEFYDMVKKFLYFSHTKA